MNSQIAGPRFVKIDWAEKGIYHVHNEIGSPEKRDTILVKKDDEGNWNPVPEVTGNIDSVTLQENYGKWRDKELVSYKDVDLRWTNGRPNVLRGRDGNIQSNEVKRLWGYDKGLNVDPKQFADLEAWREIPDGVLS